MTVADLIQRAEKGGPRKMRAEAMLRFRPCFESRSKDDPADASVQRALRIAADTLAKMLMGKYVNSARSVSGASGGGGTMAGQNAHRELERLMGAMPWCMSEGARVSIGANGQVWHGLLRKGGAWIDRERARRKELALAQKERARQIAKEEAAEREAKRQLRREAQERIKAARARWRGKAEADGKQGREGVADSDGGTLGSG